MSAIYQLMVDRELAVLLTVSALVLMAPIYALGQSMEEYFFPLGRVIEEVPYYPQKTGMDCDPASWAMVFGYFTGMSYEQFIYESGRGHRFAYLPETLVIALPNAPQDIDLLGSLYGLMYQSWLPDPGLAPETAWYSYLLTVKLFLLMGSPIVTSVDPFHLPQFEEYWAEYCSSTGLNLTDEMHGGHAIVLVGFDDSGEKIYLHDPQAQFLGELVGEPNLVQEGIYANMSYTDLRDAVSNTTGPKYYISTLVRVDEGLEDKERDEAINAENRDKISGNPESYRDCPEYFEFGIRGWEALLHDIMVINESFDSLEPAEREELMKQLNQIIPRYMINPLSYYGLLSHMSSIWARSEGYEEATLLEELSSIYVELVTLLQGILSGSGGWDPVVCAIERIIDLEGDYLPSVHLN